MELTAYYYYEAEQLAMMFIESSDGECYTECEGLTLYVYDAENAEVVCEVTFVE